MEDKIVKEYKIKDVIATRRPNSLGISELTGHTVRDSLFSSVTVTVSAQWFSEDDSDFKFGSIH